MNRAYCTDATWLGRSDCQHCAVRHMMTFSVLPEDAFTAMLRPIEHLRYEDRGTLFKQGQPGEHVFSIRRGWIKLMQGNEDGGVRIVRLMGPGSLIGIELLMPAHGGYSHTAMAHGEVDLCRIPIRTLHRLEVDHPELYPMLLQRSEGHVVAADEVIVSFSTGLLRQRIENVLAFLARETGDANGSFAMMSGADIAAMVGASEESVSRVMAEFKRQGRLQRTDGHFEFEQQQTALPSN